MAHAVSCYFMFVYHAPAFIITASQIERIAVVSLPYVILTAIIPPSYGCKFCKYSVFYRITIIPPPPFCKCLFFTKARQCKSLLFSINVNH